MIGIGSTPRALALQSNDPEDRALPVKAILYSA
jgi:hypothetical protein